VIVFFRRDSGIPMPVSLDLPDADCTLSAAGITVRRDEDEGQWRFYPWWTIIAIEGDDRA
jgi:hypothetical protein